MLSSSTRATRRSAAWGYEPQLQRLEATINIKRQTGYGGDICSAGTPEFVRFYLSFANGATCADQGMRAILSWNNLPPPNMPGFNPIWGEVQDAHIQVARARFSGSATCFRS